MEFNKLNSVFEETSKYCHFSNENDFMEVTEWKNGEGYDITINSRKLEQKFSLTYGEIDLLNILLHIKE